VCVIVLLGAGGLVYGNTRKGITASDWVEHTQEVINSLRAASQLNERVDANSHLYLLTTDEDRLDIVRTNASNLAITAAHLKALVADNADETANMQALIACSVELDEAMKALKPDSQQPKATIQRCQETLNRMLDLERRLLLERSQTTHRIEIQSINTDLVFVGLSLVTLVTLFGFLLRGAELRQRSDKQIVRTNRHLEENVLLLQEKAYESGLLTTSRDELQLCVNLPEVYRSAQNSFERLLPSTAGALCMITNSRNMMETVASWGEVALEDCHTPESCCGLRSGQPRWREPGGSMIHCSHFGGQGPEHYVCVPVVAHGDTLGLLFIQCPDTECMDSIRRRMDGLHQLVQLTGMAVASMKLRTKLENQSIRDPLTGLFNRHFMEVALERELSRARRRKTMLAVFMLDVDHFKDFNDSHGHAIGDAVLKSVAAVCQTTVRAEDIACRYGGEEFTIILPEITPEAAYERAENVRLAIANLRVFEGEDAYQEVTMSIGIALYPEDGTTADVLLRSADQALYRAKQQGRNRVLSAEPIFAS
jgi:diguanylate cyclase (GGDEF)-like protein